MSRSNCLWQRSLKLTAMQEDRFLAGTILGQLKTLNTVGSREYRLPSPRCPPRRLLRTPRFHLLMLENSSDYATMVPVVR